MSNIDPDVQIYFENYIDLFATPGWAQFKEDMQAALKDSQTTAATRCDTSDKWMQERGEQQKLMKILSFDHVMISQYEAMLERETEEQEDPVLYEDDPELANE
jgi:hypothetical protein